MKLGGKYRVSGCGGSDKNPAILVSRSDPLATRRVAYPIDLVQSVSEGSSIVHQHVLATPAQHARLCVEEKQTAAILTCRHSEQTAFWRPVDTQTVAIELNGGPEITLHIPFLGKPSVVDCDKRVAVGVPADIQNPSTLEQLFLQLPIVPKLHSAILSSGCQQGSIRRPATRCSETRPCCRDQGQLSHSSQEPAEFDPPAGGVAARRSEARR